MMEPRERFLDAVGERLPLPGSQRSEVLEELVAHLDDAVANLMTQGRERGAAELEAVARLGSPDELASALMRARRTRAQLLAAAGAGTLAAVRSGFFGALTGWLLSALVAVLITIAMRALRPALGFPSWSGWSPGWNSVITGAGLVLGALLAGASAVRVVATRGWRSPAEVRLAVAVAGFVVVGYLVLVDVEASLNWASVLVFLAVPTAFAVGAWLDRIRPPSAGWLVALTGGLLVGVLGLGATLGVSTPGGSSYQWTDEAHGYAIIAPWWQVPGSSDSAAFVIGESSWGSLGVEAVTVQAVSEAKAAQFRDYRLEAWRVEPPGDGWRLIAGQTAPFAVAQGQLNGAAISGTLRFNGEPGVEWAQVVLTAIGPNGQRYLLYASGPEQTEFYGSVWSWFRALRLIG